ncbi:hypothetical protein DE4381_01603 [Mycobacterium marinum]|nr:hypothetical protein DE4381_01603 [Mycobacterium marinum]
MLIFSGCSPLWVAASNSSKTSVTRLTTGLSSFARSPRNPLSGGGAHAGERDESDRVGHGRFCPIRSGMLARGWPSRTKIADTRVPIVVSSSARSETGHIAMK